MQRLRNEQARTAYHHQLCAAQQELVEFWAFHALIHAWPSTAWQCGNESSRLKTEDLIAFCGSETTVILTEAQMRGLMLYSGYLPTLSTANTPNAWEFEAEYVGVPAEHAAELANLIAGVM